MNKREVSELFNKALKNNNKINVLKVLKEHECSITSVVISNNYSNLFDNDNKDIVSGGEDGIIIIWKENFNKL